MNEKVWKVYFFLYILHNWILRQHFSYSEPQKKPIHILFCLVDHYEPGTQRVTPDVEKSRVDDLLTRFPKLAEKHKDYYGNLPKRTWFFPPHYHRLNNLKKLVSLCEKGYGEIELHLHHGKTKPDTLENLEKTLRQCIDEYSYFGIFGRENRKRKYGFIHGDWALDNSLKERYCGVNDELQILAKTGCYADFTFPSLNKSNPYKINSIYYATDDPLKPKSYNSGIEVEKNIEKQGDLMIIQGPLAPYPLLKNWKCHILSAGGTDISSNVPTTGKRIDLWVKNNIHVKGKKEWIIIKTHTHGAPNAETVLGAEIEGIYRYLETKYNDGKNYILHYVTARELYNIIKAVEKGENGNNPEDYRNYKIRPPNFDSSPEISEASEKLNELVFKTYAS